MNEPRPSHSTTRNCRSPRTPKAPSWRHSRPDCSFEDIPQAVIDRTVDLFLDWAGSALSGRGQRAIADHRALCRDDGTVWTDGPKSSITRDGTSPLFAAMVNAAASHVSEQDDVHNGSVFHPAAVVFPAALATGAGDRRLGAGLHHRRGRRLRGRHPRRRVPRPLALQGVPHHRHGRHHRRSGRGRQAAVT